MTKISKTEAYDIKENIVLTDYFIGTDSETDKLDTVNFRFQDVQKYLLSGLTPETGGTLRITEISYTGEDYSTASELLNAMDPNYTVMRYHLVIVSVNGYKSLLKLQNIVVGLDQDAVTDGDFIALPTSTGATGNGIASIVKTNTTGLVDTYTITFTDATTTTFQVTNGSKGDKGDTGDTGDTGNGIASITKTGTVGLVDTYTVTFTNASTTTFNVTNGANGNDGNDGQDYTSNLQKTITYPGDFTGTNFTITNAENNYSIIINNGATDVTITVPTGLMDKIQVGFMEKGAGLVTFVESGTTLKFLATLGLKMEGENANAYLEKEGSTEVFYFMGNIKA